MFTGPVVRPSGYLSGLSHTNLNIRPTAVLEGYQLSEELQRDVQLNSCPSWSSRHRNNSEMLQQMKIPYSWNLLERPEEPNLLGEMFSNIQASLHSIQVSPDSQRSDKMNLITSFPSTLLSLQHNHKLIYTTKTHL